MWLLREKGKFFFKICCPASRKRVIIFGCMTEEEQGAVQKVAYDLHLTMAVSPDLFLAEGVWLCQTNLPCICTQATSGQFHTA